MITTALPETNGRAAGLAKLVVIGNGMAGARAVEGSSAPPAPAARHGAACSASAAIPATCGAAAEVPKNGTSKFPAAVIEVPSIAATSGLVRPSSVGPRLLKNSTVEFVVSLQDSLGFERKAAAAAAEAEQMAPTDTTDTGEPPASLCAETLYAAVLKL